MANIPDGRPVSMKNLGYGIASMHLGFVRQKVQCVRHGVCWLTGSEERHPGASM